ncbi:hypothetical protein HPB50_012537 [Hyalomma asiaticum]|uniref:Uncharacterized protein n=1 Tax=Hyalomma asiaticum TaxID=266040 RepID=A0ACB7S947_HYAAI|nr:hypothetical protein HPB50_012537 [Hyalomma asiaticum]
MLKYSGNCRLPLVEAPRAVSSQDRQDVAASFWYYNGTACTKWTFPLRRCTASQPGECRTLGECSEQCVGKGRQVDSPRFGVPESGECALEHLRHPYFPNMEG